MLALSVGRATAMARAPAGLPAGIRLSDHISLGVIAKTFPLDQVRHIVAETGKASERERDLPATSWSTTPSPWRSTWAPAPPRGAALPVGGPALALGCRGGQGGRQE